MDDCITLTNAGARRFMLLKQGLLGAHRFLGKDGVLAFVREAGCVQFDPVDVCGKNAEIALNSRVKGFDKSMLYGLLYEERLLVDYFDKNLCIVPVEAWPHFARCRAMFRASGRGRDETEAVSGSIKEALRARGPLCSADLDFGDKVNWYWSDTRLSRAALERMYFCGELAIHHKKGSIKYYDLIENCIPKDLLDAPEPHEDDLSYWKWCVERRIGAVGLLWDRASAAWLGIEGMKAEGRIRAFRELLEEGRILKIRVEGMKEPLYCRASDRALIDRALAETDFTPRLELIAPLDSLLWDRRLIAALFNFDYTWEIYTPPEKRKYGHYVLPVLAGDRFVGRIELERDKKNRCLTLKNLWCEEGVRETKALLKQIDACAARLGRLARSPENK